MKQRLIAGLWIIFLLASCSQEKKIERPREVWAIRSVLDTKPRMLSIALNEELWVAYNTQTAGLYKAWTGGIKFDGPVYTSAHGPQARVSPISRRRSQIHGAFFRAVLR
jgi:cytochrome c